MISRDQVENAQIAIRDIQSSCDRLSVNIMALCFQQPTARDNDVVEGLNQTVTQIVDRLNQVTAIINKKGQ